MNAKTIGIVAVITAILVALIVVSSPDGEPRESASGFNKGESLLPGISARLDDVTRITIDKGTETLTLFKKDGTWRLEEKGGYFVKEGQAEDLLLGFRNFDFVEQKTANESFYGRLGVDAPSEEGTSSRIILEADGKEIANVIIGNLERGARSVDLRFVRIEGDDHAYLVETNADPGGSLISWIETTVLDLPPNRLASVEIQRWDGEVLNIDKPTSTTVDWELAAIPTGAEIENQNSVNSIGRSLARVNHEDVLPRSELDADSFSSRTLFAASGFDGINVEVTMLADTSGAENEWWALFDLDLNENLYEEDQTDKSLEEIREEVAEMKTLLDEWAYQLPSWKVANMTKVVGDMISFPSEDDGNEMPAGLPPSDQPMSLEDLEKFLTPEQLEQLKQNVPN